MKVKIRSVEVELADLIRFAERMADTILNEEFSADTHETLMNITFHPAGLGLDPADFPPEEDTE